MIVAYAIPKEVAPSLRFLQGWESMLHALFDSLRRAMINKRAPAFPTPALRKEREERGTHFIGGAPARSGPPAVTYQGGAHPPVLRRSC
jgi:hypothetical protein